MASFQAYLQLVLIWAVPIILVRAILTRYQSKARLPPGPPSLPLIGHFHLLPPLPHRALHNLSARYGPIIQLFLGSVPCVVASTPETAREFLKTHESCFSDRIVNAAVHHFSYGSKGFLFAAYGPYWKFVKKLCMSQLLGARTLDILHPVRRDETMKFLGVLLRKGLAAEAIDVGHELMTLANGIISRMIMSRSSSGNDDEAKEIRKLVTDTAELAGKFNLSDFIWLLKNINLQGRLNKRLKETRDRFDALLEEVIKEHEHERRKRKELHEDGQIRDLLDILLDIHEDETSEIKFSMENIKAFVLDLFMAGTDTSALTTEWALAELINHPRVMEKARQEIDSVVGTSRIVEESDMVKLPYLQAIFKETLRIHPTVPLLGRLSSDSCNVCGYEIPAKTLLLVNLWSLGRDPKLWEDPLEFRPERFVGTEASGKGNLDVRGQHFELIPFGSGRRSCPGASLAQQVVKTNLAAMIQCFEWKVNGGNGTVDMEEKPSMTLPRAHPLICVPLPRPNLLPSILQVMEQA
ncbi:3,9-dihydroxypterocarpan 6A-monooxygenase-like [Neltuma alba]|uniref:3,9-dihydroxypterocarpan 6A-monooxygenase-like n=1 Tax=Neltuma alba TaxID=207710 RepID=UPI0010A3AA12|nr:3,9-dihydroxypterocarpan 6A-monooxygenase-like [Prosopis alba]